MMFEIDWPGVALRVSWTPAPDKWIVIFFLMDWLEIELVKSRTKAYEADPTEDIRFTILLLAPLMMNTEYLSQYAFI